MTTPEPAPTQLYINENLQTADALLVYLENKRVFQDRGYAEDFEECRRSAHKFRTTLETLALTVKGAGFLRQALLDMQKACRNFVTEAGHKSEAFKNDPQSFELQLHLLRIVFAPRVGRIVEVFDLPTTDAIDSIIRYKK
jgi:hypothetical protein